MWLRNNLYILLSLIGLTTSDGNITNSTRSTSCTVNISRDLGKPTALLVHPGTTHSVRAIDQSGNLFFSGDERVLIACPGSGNYVRIKGTGVQQVTATCIGGNVFTVDGVSYQASQLTCQKWPQSVNRRSGYCLNDQTLIQTGFEISTGYLHLYDACHDTRISHTLYTKFVLGRDAAGFQTGVDRPDWVQGSFFSGLNPTDLYRRATQRVTFAVLLGSTALAEQYIHLTNDYFLSKGHMVAKADFLHGAHQLATFWYTNAAPQWQTFNGNNWNTLENDVRSYAARVQTDLEVFTGTSGLAYLNDINGNPTNLFLTTIQQMPAPRFFWKILYNPYTLAGIAFIGLNNPYQSPESVAADIRCTDICSQLNWLNWYQTNIQRGYSYCCEVNEFRNAFPDIPYFPVTGILR